MLQLLKKDDFSLRDGSRPLRKNTSKFLANFFLLFLNNVDDNSCLASNSFEAFDIQTFFDETISYAFTLL